MGMMQRQALGYDIAPQKPGVMNCSIGALRAKYSNLLNGRQIHIMGRDRVEFFRSTSRGSVPPPAGTVRTMNPKLVERVVPKALKRLEVKPLHRRTSG
jgi:hypothetical protein